MILFPGLFLSPQNSFRDTERKNITAEETNPGHCVSVRPENILSGRTRASHCSILPYTCRDRGALAPAPN